MKYTLNFVIEGWEFSIKVELSDIEAAWPVGEALANALGVEFSYPEAHT